MHRVNCSIVTCKDLVLKIFTLISDISYLLGLLLAPHVASNFRLDTGVSLDWVLPFLSLSIGTALNIGDRFAQKFGSLVIFNILARGVWILRHHIDSVIQSC
jgi:hypothetical protein